MRTLADEIADALPAMMAEFPAGPGLREICRRLAADWPNVRAAAFRLNTEGRADVMRRRSSRELFLAPLKCRTVDGMPHCANCGNPFERPPRKVYPSGSCYNDRRCCCRSCSVALSWKNAGTRAARIAGQRKVKSTPEAKARTAETNRRRWARPGEKERMSERNRRLWADPTGAALRTQAIRRSKRKPESRRKASEARKAAWRDPVIRERMLDGMRRAHGTPQHRKKLSESMKARWRDPEQRAKMTAANGAKASNRRGTRQSSGHVAKRVESTKRTKAAKRSSGAVKPNRGGKQG